MACNMLDPHANDYTHWRGEWFLFRCSWSMEINVGMLGNTAPSRNIISHLTIIPVMVIIEDGYSLCVSKLFYDLDPNSKENDPSIQFGMCSSCKIKVKMLFQSNNQNDEFTSDEKERVKINILAFSVDDKSKVFPYALKNYVYNYNSKYPFIIIIATEFSKLFYIKDKCIQVILSMYQKYQLSLIDNFVFEKKNELRVLIAEKSVSNKNCYQSNSIYSNI
ncbi:hypothetical protein H8356DRAFT_1435432 [Neocallimastix lanati (nom. inval.)]|nr:hypothetical protein H8356DRAFT_1435432 [Neocallimastix sp. JGI-2020a]